MRFAHDRRRGLGSARRAGRGPKRPWRGAVKAAYLYKFGAFVEWPATAFEGPAAPARICVTGADPFGVLLDQAVKGQTIGGHPITVTRMDHVDKGAPCTILFVAPSSHQPVADALDKVRGSPILTVTDAGAEPASRGVIDFVLKDNRVRFRIDSRAAGGDGLAISSKLLSLAVKTVGEP
ncbi:MAG: YfiR family protein [Caulobacteraceae bacterium]